MLNRKPDFWWLQFPGGLLLVYRVYAQAVSAFDYELGVRMGTQESAQQITEVGAGYWVVLPTIAAWALWGLIRVARAKQ